MPGKESLPPLPGSERLILELLVASGREMFGLELIAASNGAIKRGSVYVTLQRMAEKGLVQSREEARTAPEIGIPRRLYEPSGYGAKVLRAVEAAEAILAGGLANEAG